MKTKLSIFLLIGIAPVFAQADPTNQTIKEKTIQTLIYAKNVCKLGLGAGCCIVGASTALRGVNVMSHNMGRRYLPRGIHTVLRPGHLLLHEFCSHTQLPVAINNVSAFALGSLMFYVGQRAVNSAWQDLKSVHETT